MGNGKAQIISMDMLIALSIAVILLGFLINTFNSKIVNYDNEIEYEDMQIKAMVISELLVKYPGYPSSWNSSNVNTLGLVDSTNAIGLAKWNNFSAMEYNETLDLLNVAPYDFFIKIQYFNGTIIDTYGVNGNNKMKVAIARTVIFENEKKEFIFELWK